MQSLLKYLLMAIIIFGLYHYTQENSMKENLSLTACIMIIVMTIDYLTEEFFSIAKEKFVPEKARAIKDTALNTVLADITTINGMTTENVKAIEFALRNTILTQDYLDLIELYTTDPYPKQSLLLVLYVIAKNKLLPKQQIKTIIDNVANANKDYFTFTVLTMFLKNMYAEILELIN